jgi:hypothetical protein
MRNPSASASWGGALDRAIGDLLVEAVSQLALEVALAVQDLRATPPAGDQRGTEAERYCWRSGMPASAPPAVHDSRARRQSSGFAERVGNGLLGGHGSPLCHGLRECLVM